MTDSQRRNFGDPVPPGQANSAAALNASSQVETSASDPECALGLYERIWRRSETPPSASLEPTTWIVFLDSTGLGRQISEQLKGAEHKVIEVTPGETFARVGKRKYRIRPGHRADYDSLIVDITKHGTPPQKILHLWSVFDSSTHESVDQIIDLSFYSIFYFAQALGMQDLSAVDISLVSNRLQSISGEALGNPVRGILLGPVRLIPKVFLGMRCRAIDCDPVGQGVNYAAMQIMIEHCALSSDAVVAYRGEQRWVETWERMNSRGQSQRGPRDGGVYVVTGGLQESGLAITENLVRDLHAKVALVDNAQWPEFEQWNHLLQTGSAPERLRRALRKLTELHQTGGEVMTICADVAREGEAKRALELTYQRFGSLDGVVHLAVASEEESRQDASRSTKYAFGSAIKGTLNLKESLRANPVDFFALVTCAETSLSASEEIMREATAGFLNGVAADGSAVSIEFGMRREATSQGNRGFSSKEAAATVLRILSLNTPASVKVSQDDLSSANKPQSILEKQVSKIYSIDNKESALSEWWQDLLGLESVGLNDDFFELGGNSLIGLQLFSRIKKTYGVSLRLTVLSEARTIAQIALLIRSPEVSEDPAQPRPWSPLVPIQPKGIRPPLYVISGLGGNVIKFHSLAVHLGEDQPIYGLLPRGLDGRNAYRTSIEDVATDYVSAIRQMQRNGPYHLAGYSFGGIVAFEVAQQITAQGEEVGLLGLFDTIEWHYGDKVDQTRRPGERLLVLKEHLQNLIDSEERGAFLATIVSDKFAVFKSKLLRFLGWAVRQKIGSIEEINSFAAAAYYPRAYPGKVTLFRSAHRTSYQGSDDFLGWGDLAKGGVELHHVLATHFNILQEPVVRLLAEKLKTCLDRELRGS